MNPPLWLTLELRQQSSQENTKKRVKHKNPSYFGIFSSGFLRNVVQSLMWGPGRRFPEGPLTFAKRPYKFPRAPFHGGRCPFTDYPLPMAGSIDWYDLKPSKLQLAEALRLHEAADTGPFAEPPPQKQGGNTPR